MNNFMYANPTEIIFGQGMIEKLKDVVPKAARVLMIYGGGSILRNGVYDQVKAALSEHTVIEFAGIEPNPHYETCLQAVTCIREQKINFLLAVGGGSVLDATKFIAAAASYTGDDPWQILLDGGSSITQALPFGAVMTLPATGSEMNDGGVITRAATQEKLSFTSPHTFPAFSVLDPLTTYTLPTRQLANGLVDAFIHVMEQYLTDQHQALVQDYMAEAVVKVLIETSEAIIHQAPEYNSRANFMWAATWALNGWIGVGVPNDWATHAIGHELTALYGLDHAQTLAIVLPGVMVMEKAHKARKIMQLGRNVFGIDAIDDDALITQTIAAVEAWFHSVGMKTRLSDYQLDATAIDAICARFAERGWQLGEHQSIDAKCVREILTLRL
ncbi:iron-containing alcohol dehydrogenase [Wohlfahrtiimonas chitiniclastica]|uniref:iron-containing alcohol dehydrogenase n=1 Tax=Wohlfahrtiimonas chitiniclastica TaxID=400946 RepID=UPI000B99A683|nr:iron-containing alcohol dehydrogenase [Wohlfahrtiimonas chitiniclastica]OYQ70789.1 NADH-dependent alcohol dehydrogenase [Wohlfahrtiimonas chitiniclastica]OYQ83996.1 NADH-dependent alcohol dehydrogenase [Wohlfahrtiimonas chitiniclastica]OYQ84835.1 NADH-dependent alcohol dehydrogenase [Wohlfahrtiimonas chitiniclastica]